MSILASWEVVESTKNAGKVGIQEKHSYFLGELKDWTIDGAIYEPGRAVGYSCWNIFHLDACICHGGRTVSKSNT